MSDNDPFPDWGQRASKGDVLRVAIFARSCTLDLFGAVAALNRGDRAGFDQRMKEFTKNDTMLQEVIDDIAGKNRG